MVIYEVTTTVRAALVEAYEKYMRERHIPDLLATGYFEGAKFTCAENNRYRIQYEAPDRETLDDYLKTDATRLRDDFIQHFPEGIEVSRENWNIVQSWKAE